MELAQNADPSDWIESTVEEIYYSTIHGKWDDVRKRIWITDDNVRYQISKTNVADLYDPTAASGAENGAAENGAESSRTKRIRGVSVDGSHSDIEGNLHCDIEGDSHSEHVDMESHPKRTCTTGSAQLSL